MYHKLPKSKLRENLDKEVDKTQTKKPVKDSKDNFTKADIRVKNAKKDLDKAEKQISTEKEDYNKRMERLKSDKSIKAAERERLKKLHADEYNKRMADLVAIRAPFLSTHSTTSPRSK